MLHETPFENSEYNYLHSQGNSSNNFNLEDDRTLTVRKVDAKTDIYCTDFEKQISRLPSNLKFIKKYLYYELLPKVEKYIEELEVIKETPNYDEKIPIIKPQMVTKVGTQITCMDSFDTHNIKHMRSSKIVYGTITGSVIIYDLESQRVVCEKQLGNKSRVETISTSTIKYYDALISRIAVTVRGDPNVYLFTYNHSFTIISQESILNLKEGLQTDPVIQLSTLICNIKFSKDSFFMSLTDYSGGVRIYKFNDVPQVKDQGNFGSAANLNSAKKESISAVQLSFQQGKDKKNSMMPGVGAVPQGNTNDLSQQQGNNFTNIPILISYIKYKEPENYTILKKNKDDPNKNQGQSATTGKQNPAQQKNQPIKTPAKEAKNPVGKESQSQSLSSPLDENNYNLSPTIDENGNDLTPLLKFNKNHPFLSFVQKKLVFEERQTGGFASCLVTVGLYIAFQGTNNLKYISLYSHLTENMKSVFKIVKSKGGAILTPDESMSLGSSLAKREKEYINFLKSKLENPGLGNLNLPPIGQQVNSNDKNQKPPVKNEKEKISENSNNNNVILDLATKSEINFNTLFLITFFTSQKFFNNHNNLLAIGMNNGSILVWDAELHVDKFLLQDERADIVSISIDENYLTSGSLDGQVHIYSLSDGSLVYKCYHNAYRNNPVEIVKIFF
jgi:WD40 repeat protein